MYGVNTLASLVCVYFYVPCTHSLRSCVRVCSMSDEIVSHINISQAGELIYSVNCDLVTPTTRMKHNYPLAGFAICDESLVTVSDRIRVWIDGRLVHVLDPHEANTHMCPFTSVCSLGNFFAVTDVFGNCSVWEGSRLVEMYKLGDFCLYDVCMVGLNVIACVSDTGALYTIDRRRPDKVICSDNLSLVPPCQPTLIEWQGNYVLIIGQISGKIEAFEVDSIDQPPVNIGSVVGSSIASVSWITGYPYFVVGRDSGRIEIWDVENLRKICWQHEIQQSVGAVKYVQNEILVGTSNGEILQVPVPKGIVNSNRTIKQFDDTIETHVMLPSFTPDRPNSRATPRTSYPALA